MVAASGFRRVLVVGLVAAGACRDRRVRPQAPRAAPRRDRRGDRVARPSRPRRPPPRSRARVGDDHRWGKGPDGVAVSGGKVFVANQQGGDAVRHRPRDERGASGSRWPAGTRPDGIVAGKGVVWLGERAGRTPSQRFQAAGRARARPRRCHVGDRPEAISLGKQLVWVANRQRQHRQPDRPRVAGDRRRADRRRLQARRHLRRPPLRLGHELAATTPSPGSTRPPREVVGTPISVGHRPRGVIETASAAWIANSGDGTVTRLDRRTGEPSSAPIKVGREPAPARRSATASSGSRNNDDNSVTRLDQQTGQRRRLADPGRSSGRSASPPAPASIWVTNHESTTRSPGSSHTSRPHRHGHDGLLRLSRRPHRTPTRSTASPGSSTTAARTTGRCCSITPRRCSSAPATIVLQAGRARSRPVPARRRLAAGPERRDPPDHHARRGRVPRRRPARRRRRGDERRRGDAARASRASRRSPPAIPRSAAHILLDLGRILSARLRAGGEQTPAGRLGRPPIAFPNYTQIPSRLPLRRWQAIRSGSLVVAPHHRCPADRHRPTRACS